MHLTQHFQSQCSTGWHENLSLCEFVSMTMDVGRGSSDGNSLGHGQDHANTPLYGRTSCICSDEDKVPAAAQQRKGNVVHHPSHLHCQYHSLLLKFMLMPRPWHKHFSNI